jgi:hypothetical protein
MQYGPLCRDQDSCREQDESAADSAPALFAKVCSGEGADRGEASPATALTDPAKHSDLVTVGPRGFANLLLGAMTSLTCPNSPGTGRAVKKAVADSINRSPSNLASTSSPPAK